jgi:hypothetical protein
MGMLERLMEWIGRRDHTLAGAGHPPGDTTPEPAVAEFDEDLERGAEEAGMAPDAGDEPAEHA